MWTLHVSFHKKHLQPELPTQRPDRCTAPRQTTGEKPTTPDGPECPPPRFSHSFCDSLQIWKGEEICKKETWLNLKEM